MPSKAPSFNISIYRLRPYTTEISAWIVKNTNFRELYIRQLGIFYYLCRNSSSIALIFEPRFCKYGALEGCFWIGFRIQFYTIKMFGQPRKN